MTAFGGALILPSVDGRVGETILGRDGELAALRSALDRDGRPLDVVIRGEAGIGKTSVWLAACHELRAAGRTLLVTRPTEAESTLPYAALVDLLDPVAVDAELASLAAPLRAALEVVLLRRPPEVISDLAVSSAALRIIERAASQAQVVLALDDAQWIDPASARTLAFVLRRVHGADITVLSTVRNPLVSAVGHDHGGGFVELLLEGLDLDGLAQVVEMHLGRSLLLPALVQLRRLSQGNPLAALELARTADARGLELSVGSPVPVPERLEALLRQRLLSLPDDVRRVLVVAACAAPPDVPLLVHALGGELDVARLLRDSERAGVLRIEGDAVRFDHPLLAYVLLDTSTADERRAAHAALAAVVVDEVERGRHLAVATADPDPGIADAVEESAHRAADRAAPASAALLLEEAVRLTPADLRAVVARRSVDAVSAWLAAGDGQRAVTFGRRIADGLPPSRDRGRVLAVLAEALATTDTIRVALPVWEQAVEEVRGDDQATAEVLGILAWERTVAGELYVGLRLAAEAVAAAERHGDRDTLGATLGMLAMLQFLRGDPASRGTLEHALSVAPAASASPAGRELERRQAMMAVWGDDPEAPSMVAARLAAAEARGDIGDTAFWRWFQILIALRAGDLHAARAGAMANRREQELLARHGDTSSDLWLSSLVEAHIGHADDARREAELAVAAARDEGVVAFELWSEGVLGFIDLSLGWYADAADRLWDLTRRCERLGYDEPGHLRSLADAAEALLLDGRVVEARHVVERLRAIADRTGDRWAAGAALRCEAMSCEVDDRGRALVLLEAARDRHVELGQPFELGRTLLALGATARRARRKAEARTALEQAAALFAALPAPLWLARAEGELDRIGGGSSSRWELTSTERRIADLVASGRTNREVADELFVTVKTVEWNLSKVYRKVGVRSRSELARSWGARVTAHDRSGGSPGSREAGAP